MDKKKEDITPRNEADELHGLCIFYYVNGKLWYKERYVNGERHGITEWYFDDVLMYKQYWLNGKFVYGEWYCGFNRIEFNI